MATLAQCHNTVVHQSCSFCDTQVNLIVKKSDFDLKSSNARHLVAINFGRHAELAGWD